MKFFCPIINICWTSTLLFCMGVGVEWFLVCPHTSLRSNQATKPAVKQWGDTRWQSQWVELTTCKQTKIFFLFLGVILHHILEGLIVNCWITKISWIKGAKSKGLSRIKGEELSDLFELLEKIWTLAKKLGLCPIFWEFGRSLGVCPPPPPRRFQVDGKIESLVNFYKMIFGQSPNFSIYWKGYIKNIGRSPKNGSLAKIESLAKKIGCLPKSLGDPPILLTNTHGGGGGRLPQLAKLAIFERMLQILAKGQIFGQTSQFWVETPINWPKSQPYSQTPKNWQKSHFFSSKLKG